MKPLRWRGDSKEVFMEFPEECHDYLGDGLRAVQNGDDHTAVKPMPTVGDGVCELRQRHKRVAYRVVYVAKLEGAVYVLHCFTKDAAEGNRTRQSEVKTIKDRYRTLKDDIEDEKKSKKKLGSRRTLS
jgi:phage-related protein